MYNLVSQSLKNPSIQLKPPRNFHETQQSGINDHHETPENLENGITETREPTVIKKGGINRVDPSTLQNSGINTGERGSRGKKGTCINGGKGHAHDTLDRCRFRQRPVLHTHRLDGIVKVKTLDVEKTIRDLTTVLEYGEYLVKEKEGEKFRTITISEKRGESIVISHGKVENVYIIHVITHKPERMNRYAGYLKRVLGIDIYTLMAEAYVRYHAIDEYKVQMALDGIKRENPEAEGSPVNIVKYPRRGIWEFYLYRGKIYYKGAKVVLKSYRHKSYRHYKITDPNFHPKLEQLTVIRDASTSKDVMEYLKEYAKLLYTIAYTLNITTIEGDYEKTETTRFETTIDPFMKKLIRGVKSKNKGETLLERQYRNKRDMIAKLLDRGLEIKVIAEIVDYTERHTKRVIRELLKEGVIIRVGRGKYKLNPKYKPPQEERRVVDHHGDLKQFRELIQHNSDKVVKVYLDGTPYVDIKEKTEFGVIITRYIFTRIMVYDSCVKLRDRGCTTTTKRELEAYIKQILNKTEPPLTLGL